MNIYIHRHASMVQKLQSHAIELLKSNSGIDNFIIAYAANLAVAFENRNEALAIDISNYYKPLIGKSRDEIFKTNLREVDFLDIAASVHGFGSYESIIDKDEILDAEFEKAVDAVVSGEIGKLEGLLKRNPKLINQHSQFGHEAQLIHYCASNAVEIYRQVVPENLLDVIKLLLACGADPKVKIPVYEGEYDFFELFSTSTHPRESGIDKVIYEWFDSIGK